MTRSNICTNGSPFLPIAACGFLLCLQELLAPVFIGLQALLMGKNDLFLAFYRPVKAICAVQRLQKPPFCLFLPIILASRPMNTSASSS
jgi:hypothetical protein